MNDQKRFRADAAASTAIQTCYGVMAYCCGNLGYGASSAKKRATIRLSIDSDTEVF
jgi:hypothetical protein